MPIRVLSLHSGTLASHPLAIIPAMDAAHMPLAEIPTMDNAHMPTISLPNRYERGVETNSYAFVKHFASDISTGAADRAQYLPVLIPFRMTVTRIKIEVKTQSGNIDVGIYDAALDRVVSTGSIGCPSTGVATITISSTVLDPGLYYLAIAADNTTLRLSDVETETAKSLWKNTNFPLPASMVSPSTGGYGIWMEVC